MRYEVFDSDEALVRAAAGRWVDEVVAGRCRTVALSGGRIAGRLFSATVNASQERGADWSRVDWFWADERQVASDHVDGNYRQAREHLLIPLGVPSERVHRIRGEELPRVAVQESERELIRIVGVAGVLDLVLLGMGEDGHVASLFPGVQPAEVGSEGLYCAVVGPKPPPRRVSLTYEAITRARRVWVVVAGEGKAEVLGQAAKGDAELPLGRVIRDRVNTELFVHV